MSRSGTRSRRAARLDDLAALLKLLAVRGRRLAPPTAEDASVAHIVDSSSKRVAAIPAIALEAGLRKGWLVAEFAHGPLHLTPSGREAWRRMSSRLTARRAALRPVKPVADTSAAAQVNLSESPLTWLASRRDSAGKPMLSEAQVAAGERLRGDLYVAQLTPRVTMGWSGRPADDRRSNAPTGVARDLTDNAVAARARVTSALKAVGPELGGILIDVCGHLLGLEDISRVEGWPPRAARLLLQRALTALARHYGLEREIPVEETIARRLRHWGADGYRPALRAPGPRPSDQAD